MSTNNITGDEIKTGATSEEYAKGYDAIFRKPTKPTVEYFDAIHIEVGSSAFVLCDFHPHDHLQRLEGDDQVLRTSKVVSHDEETGSFETKNTLYVKKVLNA